MLNEQTRLLSFTAGLMAIPFFGLSKRSASQERLFLWPTRTASKAELLEKYPASLSLPKSPFITPMELCLKCNTLRPMGMPYCVCEFDTPFPVARELPMPDDIPEALRPAYRRGEVGRVKYIEIDEETNVLSVETLKKGDRFTMASINLINPEQG